MLSVALSEPIGARKRHVSVEYLEQASQTDTSDGLDIRDYYFGGHLLSSAMADLSKLSLGDLNRIVCNESCA
jgi:hypothetical protein